jgi:ketosteroid isomerase-like protein
MRRHRGLAVVLSLVALVACTPAEKAEDAQAAQAAGPSDAFLDSTLTVFLNAMKAKDATPTADLYAENAVSYPPNAAPLEGKNAIVEYNKAWFASVEADSMAAGRDGALSSGDLAVETGWFYFKGKMGGQAMEDRGRYMNVWQRQADGSWKMVRDMANSSMPMPGAPPTGSSKK